MKSRRAALLWRKGPETTRGGKGGKSHGGFQKKENQKSHTTELLVRTDRGEGGGRRSTKRGSLGKEKAKCSKPTNRGSGNSLARKIDVKTYFRDGPMNLSTGVGNIKP